MCQFWTGQCKQDVYKRQLEQVAIQVNTDSEKIDILKEHLCKQRGIKLIKLPMKPNEVEPELSLIHI